MNSIESKNNKAIDAELDAPQDMEIIFSLLDPDSFLKFLLEKVISSSSSSFYKEVINNNILEIRFSISQIFSNTGLRFLKCISEEKAFTTLTASRIVMCTKRQISNLVMPLVELDILQIEHRDIGGTKPVRIFSIKDATHGHKDKAETEHKRLQLPKRQLLREPGMTVVKCICGQEIIGPYAAEFRCVRCERRIKLPEKEVISK